MHVRQHLSEAGGFATGAGEGVVTCLLVPFLRNSSRLVPRAVAPINGFGSEIRRAGRAVVQNWSKDARIDRAVLLRLILMARDGKGLEALVSYVEKALGGESLHVTTNSLVKDEDGVIVAEFDITIKARAGSGSFDG